MCATLNGAGWRDSNTQLLVLELPDLIANLSAVCTLEPGDVVTVVIEKLGVLRNRVLAEP